MSKRTKPFNAFNNTEHHLKSEKKIFLSKQVKQVEKIEEEKPILSKILSNQLKNKNNKQKMLHNPSNPLIRTKHITLNDDNDKNSVMSWSLLELHNYINNRKSIRQNEIIVNYLMNLEPFTSQLQRVMGNSKEELIRKISIYYHSEIYLKGSLIFRYGSDADKFYIIHQGKVAVFFPYYENNMMNETEYFSYLLRLRRYGENEMLNNVLLLNQNTFLLDDYNFDIWIRKAYNTLLKMKIDPSFINKDPIRQNKKNYKIHTNNRSSSCDMDEKVSGSAKKDFNSSLQNYFRKDADFFEENELFDSKPQKMLVLSLEKEIIETISLSFPHLYKEIKQDKKSDNKFTIISRPKVPLAQIISPSNSAISNTNITVEQYIERILPPQIPLEDQKLKKVIVLKYFLIKYLTKGEHFGDILSDSMSLFTQSQLSQLKKASNTTNIQIHQYNSFRLISAVAVEDTYIGTIPKKCYIDYFKNAGERMNIKKLNYILNNQLFVNSNCPQLIKTYSVCFIEKKLKQGDILIREGDTINKDKIKLFFIEQGEFAVTCNKSIEQLDKLICQFGYGDLIDTTFPKCLHDLIDTPYYEQLLKSNILIMKLNYLQINDIVGLSEVTNEGVYAFTVTCTSKTASVYEVNGHIIRLLVESDKIISENKDKILLNKFKIYSELLLKQRKTKFDCFFRIERTKYEPIKKKSLSSSKEKNIKILLKKPQGNNEPKFPSLKAYNLSTTKMMHKASSASDISTINNSTNNKTNSILQVKQCRNRSFKKSNLMINNKSSDSFEFDNVKISFCKERHSKKKNKSNNEKSDQIGDLDVFLANSSGKITMQDLRDKKSQKFIEKMHKKKLLLDKKKLSSVSSSKKPKRKILLSARLRNVLPNMKINKKIDGNNNLEIMYYKDNAKNAPINPLAYDDFNRTYNTSLYFRNLFKENPKKSFNFGISLKIKESKSNKPLTTRKACVRSNSYVSRSCFKNNN